MLTNPVEFPQNEAPFFIQGPAGALEVMVAIPKQDIKPLVGVICHPHSLFGGTMHNKVVTTLSKTLLEMDIVTVRFNFRGVGKSAGQFDSGIGESDDLLAIIHWVKQIKPDVEIWLAGFSFGAFVATRVASFYPAKQLITIAPPVGNFPMAALPRPDCPWLIVQGDQDEVISSEKVFAWVDTLQPPAELIRMIGAGHFFHGRLTELKEKLQVALI